MHYSIYRRLGRKYAVRRRGAERVFRVFGCQKDAIECARNIRGVTRIYLHTRYGNVYKVLKVKK